MIRRWLREAFHSLQCHKNEQFRGCKKTREEETMKSRCGEKNTTHLHHPIVCQCHQITPTSDKVKTKCRHNHPNTKSNDSSSLSTSQDDLWRIIHLTAIFHNREQIFLLLLPSYSFSFDCLQPARFLIFHNNLFCLIGSQLVEQEKLSVDVISNK